MQGKKHYTEKLFANFQLSDRVPQDNFYRKLKQLLDLHYLYKLTEKYYGTEGQASIDPVVFFKLILIGYFENLGSDRRIIQAAGMRLDMLYFLGYDIDEALPWHSTLSRTRHLYGEEVFKGLFLDVLRQCVEKGMVAGKRQAMDSVHVKANASMDSLVQKDIMDDGATYTTELKEEGENSTSGGGDEDKNDHHHPTVSASKHKAVRQHHKWKEKAYRGQPGSMDKRSKFVSNHTHYSTTDADARVAVKPGKPRQLNYLGQISVDTASHVITHIQADHADKKDSQCLPSLLHNTISNLKAQGLKVKEVICDAGYSSSESLKTLQDLRITGYIPNFGMYKPSREGFRYFAGGDYYKCSRGVKLPFKRIKDSHGGAYQMKVYRSSSKDCGHCPLRSTCIGKSDFKKIEDTVDKYLYNQMHERLQTPKARRMKKLRQSTVEPVLGTLVNFLAMRRVNTRGIKAANKCMLMAACAYNLKKLLKWITPVDQLVKQGLEKAEKTLANLFSLLWLFLKQHVRQNQLVLSY